MSKTEVLFCFDTENYTNNTALTSIKYTADILNAEGVRGNYQMVGYVAQKLVENRRFDVLDALKPHVINTHTKAHSLHPNITEYTDIEDMDKAIELALRDEGEAIGMIKAATGVDRVLSAVPPGNSFTTAGLYAYAKLGLPTYSDAPARMPGNGTVWYCGLLSMNYAICVDGLFTDDNYDEAALLDQIATYKRCLLYHHPGMAEFTTHWDIVNYYEGNLVEWGEWKLPPRRPTEVTVRFYERFASLVRAIKADDRFDITDTERFINENSRTRTVKREDMPKYLAALKAQEESGVIDPLVFSRGDCEHISLSEGLYAAVKMLFGADEVSLDGVIIKGFVNEPKGIPCEVKLPFDHIARAAKAIDFDKFLPDIISCGTYRIGPMDLLMAVLEAVCDPSKLEFTIKPKMQQPSLDLFPYLRDMQLKNTWVFWDKFEDKYTSDRLRWQAWTIHD